MKIGRANAMIHPTGIANDPIVTHSAHSLSPNQTLATLGGPLIVKACPIDEID